MNITTPQEAHKLLKDLGATQRLITHVTLVGEAAEELLSFLSSYAVELDQEFVRLGVAFHDAGKILHEAELDGPGNNHEPEGERMLLEAGVDPKVARCCLSHARFGEMECSIEELLVALSDKLWKGKRVESLEIEVIDRIPLLWARSVGIFSWILTAVLSQSPQRARNGWSVVNEP